MGDDENNYLKINYYINNINISNEQQFNIDSKYFNYIKDVLQETRNGSLYYELTQGTSDIGIKSINSSIRTILKHKIIFSIKIELNRKSYSHIKEIIEKVYNYIQKIRTYINNLKKEDSRVKDLFNIFKQHFTFMVDEDDEQDFAEKTKKLFYLDNRHYFLKNDWFPNHFDENINTIKEYFNQLTMNNSVIILGINKYTKNVFELENTDIKFLFENYKTTKYFNLSYTCNDLSKLNIKLNEPEKNITIGYINNVYMSKWNEETKVHFNVDDEDRFYDNKTEIVCGNNSEAYRIFLFRDYSFKVPKVFITLYILHPFLRPNLTETENDNLFFQIMLYVSYLKDEINNQLADAIRAKSEFKVDFNENYIFIDIYSFNDTIHRIVEKIVEIISNSKSKIENNYEIYRDYVLEDLNSKGKSLENRIKLAFYKHIYDDLPIYNYYEFPIDKFKNKKSFSLDSALNSSIIQGYIYGYYSKEETKNICKIFNNYTNGKFNESLKSANLNNKNISIENFVNKLMNRIKIKENISDENYTEEIEIENKIYFFKRMSKYDFNSSVYAYIIKDIFDDIISNINVQMATQKYIHLKIECKKDENCTTDNIKGMDGKIIKEINKSGLNKTVDVIGDRFYYYLQNTQNMLLDTHDTMRTAAIQKSIENLYDTPYASDKKDYFDISFEEFKKKIVKLNEDYRNYIIFK